MKKRLFFILGIFALLLSGTATVAYANHAWGNYHWARSANPLLLVLGDNVTSTWDAYLRTASTDWSASSVIDTIVVPGLSSVRTCKPTLGRVEVCNNKYGSNGWLGIASIWANGDHITQGTVKLNDTYFSTRTYNTPAWRQLVTCQEVAHTFGLDHQDEVFTNANLGTCMDYTNDPSTNQHPNAHDFAMLETIYAHIDGVASSSVAVAQNGNDINTEDPKEWGREIHRSKDGRASVFHRDLGNGRNVFTHVFWAESRN
jgi:hypothetical protein